MLENNPLSLWIHPSQLPHGIHQQRVRALEKRKLPPELNYISPQASELWLTLSNKYSPTHKPEYQQAHIAFFRDIARAVEDKDLQLIGLGCGAGTKEGWLIDRLQSASTANRSLKFTAVDISAELTLQSMELASSRLTSESVRGIVANLTEFLSLNEWLTKTHGTNPRLFTLFGVLPNIEPEIIFPLLSQLLREGDTLILSANLAPLAPAGDESQKAYEAGMDVIRPQYDNDETRKWLLQGWRDLSKDTESEVDIRIERKEVDGLLAHVGELTLPSPMNVSERVKLQKGETLRLFYSLRYTPGRLRQKLQDFGLRVAAEQIYLDGEEGLWAVQKNC